MRDLEPTWEYGPLLVADGGRRSALSADNTTYVPTATWISHQISGDDLRVKVILDTAGGRNVGGSIVSPMTHLYLATGGGGVLDANLSW